MRNYDEVGHKINDLKFWQQTGKALPTMAECKCGNRIDYDMLEALLMIQPELAKEFGAKYDQKKKQVVYRVLIPEMEKDVKMNNFRAIRVICFGLSSRHFKAFSRSLENPSVRDYMEAAYERFREARKTAVC